MGVYAHAYSHVIGCSMVMRNALALENTRIDTGNPGQSFELKARRAKQAAVAFRSCQKVLLRYLERRLACRSDAEDVAQEAFVRLVTSTRIDSEVHAKAFLFRVARNLATDELRRQRLRSRADMVETAALLTSATEPPPPEEFWQILGRLEVLEGSVAALPHRCREVFMLHKFEGLSHRDIASRLEISINAIEAHIVRGLAHCRVADKQYLAAGLTARVGGSSHSAA
jgi:RNA polymerase sigma factor (sigma-70 family)